MSDEVDQIGGYDPEYVPAQQVSRATGVPKAGIIRMAKEGQIPSVFFGKRMMFNVDRVLGCLRRLEESSLTPPPDEVS